MRIGQTIAEGVLDRPVDGFNLPDPATLGQVLGREPSLLVFLRHHG